MHFYKFHIGDYKSHTSHLDPLEDIAYRRMMDWQYLHERELPLDIQSICKAIGMRSHSECIEYVLQEFYEETDTGYINKRVTREITEFHNKSQKARESAKARWSKDADNANALRTHSEGNANHKPLTINHEPVINTSPNGEESPQSGDAPLNGKKPCPHKAIIEIYHDKLKICPRIREWNDTRKGYLRSRWNEKEDRQDLEWWARFFEYCSKSDFLTGRTDGRDGKPPFIADLEWMIRPSNFAKIIEGKYHR